MPTTTTTKPQEPRMAMVTIYHNTAVDEMGRPLGMMDGYSPGHPLVAVHRYTDVAPNLERIYEIFNVGDDPLFAGPAGPNKEAVTYRANRNRSLSVGDVVAITSASGGSTTTVYHTVAAMGFQTLAVPPRWFSPGSSYGTTAMERSELVTR